MGRLLNRFMSAADVVFGLTPSVQTAIVNKETAMTNQTIQTNRDLSLMLIELRQDAVERDILKGNDRLIGIYKQALTPYKDNPNVRRNMWVKRFDLLDAQNAKVVEHPNAHAEQPNEIVRYLDKDGQQHNCGCRILYRLFLAQWEENPVRAQWHLTSALKMYGGVVPNEIFNRPRDVHPADHAKKVWEYLAIEKQLAAEAAGCQADHSNKTK